MWKAGRSHTVRARCGAAMESNVFYPPRLTHTTRLIGMMTCRRGRDASAAITFANGGHSKRSSIRTRIWDMDHGHRDVDVHHTIASYMAWKYPDMEWKAWRPGVSMGDQREEKRPEGSTSRSERSERRAMRVRYYSRLRSSNLNIGSGSCKGHCPRSDPGARSSCCSRGPPRRARRCSTPRPSGGSRPGRSSRPGPEPCSSSDRHAAPRDQLCSKVRANVQASRGQSAASDENSESVDAVLRP